jgi:NADH-quinone oxidoreductase subunit L
LEESTLIKLTLSVLGAGTVLAGLVNIPVFFGGSESFSLWLNLPDLRRPLSHTSEILLLILNIAVAFSGIFFAYSHYKSSSQDPSLGWFDNLLLNKFYIDEILHALVVRPLDWLSDFISKTLDENLIDGFIHAISSSYQRLSYYSDYVQNGNVRYYALYMSVGIVGIFVYLFIGGY